LKRAAIKPDDVSQVIMGCVLTAGIGQAPARQAAIFSGIPATVPAMTIGKVCGSGLKAVMLAKNAIEVGESEIVVAGGMENMSLAPHLLEKSRGGYRLGHAQISDSMIKDGLWDVYHQFHMGSAAELCAKKYRFSREEQDDFAKESYRRAQRAEKEGLFKEEIAPFVIPHFGDAKGNSQTISEDEEPQKFLPEKIPALRPAFEKEGTVTAANASKINDGAAAVVLMTEELAKKRGFIDKNHRPLAKIIAQVDAAGPPEWFTTAPIAAIQKVLSIANLSVKDIDLFEINEAFAVAALAAIKDLSLDPKKVNVHGGAVALGHPIGASGARILTTLLYAMKHHRAKRGLAAICIGGGEASAMVVESIS
ncbi:MAG: acetyl-CoA C-acyltransferase, partial [Deltaproteobacteria bacterium]